jgi:hypothetical protein
VFKYFAGAAAVALVAATSVSAQQPARDSEKARYNLFTMEGVLERAVEQGANQLRRQVQRLMPDMLLMPPRRRCSSSRRTSRRSPILA